MPIFYEFFAGGGMARAGLRDTWRCIFANDFDHKKNRTYIRNWGAGVLKTADIRALKLADVQAMPIWHGLLFLARTYRLPAVELGSGGIVPGLSGHYGTLCGRSLLKIERQA
jgi:DNA (cytosine-5)-methyltransferase 1